MYAHYKINIYFAMELLTYINASNGTNSLKGQETQYVNRVNYTLNKI